MPSFGENDQSQLALWEMSHQFFNSLQVIDGLLAGAIRDMGAEEAAAWGMQSIRGRVRAISHLHRRMNHPQGFGELLESRCRDICIDLVRCFGREDVTPWVEMDEVTLDPDREGQVLLLIVELVTNALKHSRCDGRGIIWIDLRQGEAGHVELRVRDNGALHPDRELTAKPMIAEALAKSLGGEMGIRTNCGFNVLVRFPLVAPTAFGLTT